MSAVMEWILAHLTAEGILCVVYGLLLALLLAPVLDFLGFGWRRRKQEFLNSMSEMAAARYFSAFRASEYAALCQKMAVWDPRRQQVERADRALQNLLAAQEAERKAAVEKTAAEKLLADATAKAVAAEVDAAKPKVADATKKHQEAEQAAASARLALDGIEAELKTAAGQLSVAAATAAATAATAKAAATPAPGKPPVATLVAAAQTAEAAAQVATEKDAAVQAALGAVTAARAAPITTAAAAEMAARYKQALAGTRKLFAQFFDKQFSIGRFLIPLGLLLSLAACLLYLCLLGGLRWLRQGSFDGPDVRLDVLIGILQGWGFSADVLSPIRPIPPAIVLAILGGYSWVVYDLIDRASRAEISPIGLLWSSFRLVVAVPAAYAISYVFNKDLALPIAYLLGTLPTGALMMLGRRALARSLHDPDAPDHAMNQVQHLISVDAPMSDRLAAEGITTFAQLAYADPVLLSIRTGLNFSVVIGLASEAMLGLYLVKKERLEAARQFGLCGSFECANLWDDLQGPAGPERTRAEKMVKDLARLLKTTEQPEPSEEAVINILREIAIDPYTDFLRECWGSNLE